MQTISSITIYMALAGIIAARRNFRSIITSVGEVDAGCGEEGAQRIRFIFSDGFTLRPRVITPDRSCRCPRMATLHLGAHGIVYTLPSGA